VVKIISCAMDASENNLPVDPSTGMRRALDYSSSDSTFEEMYQLVSSLAPYQLPSPIEHQLNTIRLIQAVFMGDAKGLVFKDKNQAFLHTCILYLAKSIICGNTSRSL
jgi:hypothetical protein